MSEERSWAEDTVVLGSRELSEAAEPQRAAPTLRPPRRGPGRWAALALIAGVGAVVIAIVPLTGGGEETGGGAMGPKRELTLPLERERVLPATRDDGQVHPQARPLEVAEARQAPKPKRSRTELAPSAPPVGQEPVPAYKPVPEPAPAPEPSTAPAAETPAAVEFGM